MKSSLKVSGILPETISIIFVRQEATSDGSPVSSNESTHATDSMDGNQSS